MALPFKWKMSHKLFALVLLPVILELLFVFLLGHNLNESRSIASREAHAKHVIVKCDGIHDRFYNAGVSLAGFTTSRNEEFGTKYFENLNNVMHDLRTIEILVKDDAVDQQQSFEKIRESCGQGIQMLEDYRAGATQTGRTSTSFSISQMKGSMSMTLDRILTSIQELVLEERKISDIAPKAQERLEGNIQFILYGSAVLIVIIATISVFLVYKGIVTRIGVVVNNTKRIVTHEPLLPLVKGSDEITLLDKVFHDMADEIDRVAKHKQELVSMVSHDLRSPLMSVQVSLELISSGAIGELQARMGKEVNAASRNVKRLIELINDLLDIEKMEAGRLDMHITKNQVLPLIESAIDSVSGSASKKGIFIQRPIFDVTVDCDHQRLVQVLVNLLSNSIKFSPENGEIGIEVEDGEKEVKIKVRDDGPGIEQASIDKIFERFQQAENKQDVNETNRAKKGTGLGLAICKAIVAGHDGKIGVDSQVGKGSTFWFTLPRRPEV